VAPQTLQPFELRVLLEVLRQGGEAYSVPLVLELERRLGRPVAPAAVFIVLTRLERKGLVTSRLHEPAEGRVRRYFKVTRQGVEAVKEERQEQGRLWRGLSRILRARRT